MNLRRMASVLCAVCLGAALAGTAQADTPVAPDRIRALERQIDALKAEVDSLRVAQAEQTAAPDPILEKRVRELEAGMTERAADEAPFTAGWKGNHPLLKSADGQHELYLGGRIGVEGLWTAGDGEVKDDTEDGFIIRRVRFTMKGKVYKYYHFKMELNWDEASASVKDAYINMKQFDPINIQVGLMKAPVSGEDLQSSSNIHLPERSLLNSLVPDRDVGIMFHGHPWKLFTYQVAWMDGWNVRKSKGADVDDDKTTFVRVMLTPFAKSKNKWINGLEFGGNFSWGMRRNAGPSGAPGSSLATPTGYKYFSWMQPFNGQAMTYGAELRYYGGPVHFMAEWLTLEQDVNSPGMGRENFQQRAWFVQAGVVLTGEDASFGGLKPRKNFDPTGAGGWGAFEIVLRYSNMMSPHEAIDEGYASGHDTADCYNVGLNWYMNPSVKYMIMYEHTRFGSGSSGVNNEDAVLMKLQLKF